MYRSTKVWGPFSTCFRQPGAQSHCSLLHGYGLTFKATFQATHLDENGWVMDFGALKHIKATLELYYDHKLVVSRYDPLLPELEALERKKGCKLTVLSAVGCEAFARHAGLGVQQWLNDQDWNQQERSWNAEQTEEVIEPARVRIHSMEVREHEANSAIWYLEK